MSEWVRPLFRDASAPATWHVARDKGATSRMFCGEEIRGPLEVAASEERARRDGHCEPCQRVEAEWRERSPIGARR